MKKARYGVNNSRAIGFRANHDEIAALVRAKSESETLSAFVRRIALQSIDYRSNTTETA